MRADTAGGMVLMMATAEPPGDALGVLAVRAAAGDDAAFEELLAATQRRVAALAYRLLGSREAALDASQEVYLRVHRSLKGYRPDQEFAGWLYRIAINVCRDQFRKLRPTVPLGEGADEPAASDDVEGRAADAERAALLRSALAGLPEKERFALVLHDLEGRPTEEVARILGVHAVTVRGHLCSARKRLRKRFEERGRRP